MKKLLFLAALCLIAIPARQVWAQNDAPETAKTSRNVLVVGEVGKPGKFPFVEGEKVIALLERAGGATALASIVQLYVLRDGVKITLDLSQPEVANQFILLEDDVLVVPKNPHRIYVLGSVARPGSYHALERKPTFVLDALALAGGMLSNPAKVKIGILHDKPKFSVDWYDWPKDMNAPLFKIPLQDGDGIYVKSEKPKSGFQLLNKS